MGTTRLLAPFFLLALCLDLSVSKAPLQPPPEKIEEYYRLFTSETLGIARDRMASYKFQDEGLHEIIVDSRKTFNAILFKVKKKGDDVVSIGIYVARPRETGVDLRKSLAKPNADMDVLVSKLKLK